MPFKFLVDVFAAHGAKATQEKLEKVLTMYRSNLEKVEKGRVPRVQAKDNFFPIMRLLLPHLDRSRKAYNLKEVGPRTTALHEYTSSSCLLATAATATTAAALAAPAAAAAAAAAAAPAAPAPAAVA
jgi:hypothetical protein